MSDTYNTAPKPETAGFKLSPTEARSVANFTWVLQQKAERAGSDPYVYATDLEGLAMERATAVVTGSDSDAIKLIVLAESLGASRQSAYINTYTGKDGIGASPLLTVEEKEVLRALAATASESRADGVGESDIAQATVAQIIPVSDDIASIEQWSAAPKTDYEIALLAFATGATLQQPEEHIHEHFLAAIQARAEEQ